MTIHFPSGSTHRVTWEPQRYPFISPKMITTPRDVEHGHPPPHKVFTTITEGETITRCPHWFPDSCSYRRRTTKKGVVELSHLFSDPSPNGAQLEPWIRSLLWPDCTLSPLSPKVESGPVGDPVVSDPMHPRRDTPVSRQDPNTVREEPTVLSTVSLATQR